MYGGSYSRSSLVDASFATFALLSALSPDLEVLLVTRFATGFGLGGAPVAFGLFAEFVPTQSRGTQLTVLEGVFWTLGTITECLVAMVVLKTYGWRCHTSLPRTR